MSSPQDEAALAGRMAAEMQAKLAQHSDRTHWRDCDIGFLFDRLAEEVYELREAQRLGEPLWAEAADVANFAAMIADSVSDGGEDA